MAGWFRPMVKVRTRFYDLGLVLGGSLLLALSAQVTVPLPLVPLTGQTFAVLLLGALLGARLGAWTVLAYLAEGAAGLPVFSQGRSGLGVLLGPTGGYLIGFLVAAAAVGFLAQRGWDRRPYTAVVAMIFGSSIIYAFGLWWLRCLTHMEIKGLLAVGLYPFIWGDLIKAVLAAILLPFGWRFLSKTGLSPESQK